ncbi:hypothetical protein IMCC26134_14490 [Verrucomicrobia bacterium IMCC26134]|nr:hypothetical protein IMCC26134_14490 [Verrucomicrobia bacterium IMCC26134]
MPPPLPVAARPRNHRSALALSLLWPGLGQFHNRQHGLGALFLIGNTALYLAAIPWGRFGQIYRVIQEQTGALVEGRADPEKAFAVVLKTASAPLPALTAVLVVLALIGALLLHTFVAWQAWHYARQKSRPPALPA